MKIVAIGIAKNEADVVAEGVREALRWADHYILYSSSDDGTDELAQRAGAIVIPGDVNETFNEGLRQHAHAAAMELEPDWIWRVDPDEIYHREPDPRRLLGNALAGGAACIRALILEFWLTLDDVACGLLLEDESVSVQERRRWYTCGHMAMVAWRPRADLAYRMDMEVQRRRNVPVLTDGRDVSELGPCLGVPLVQKHYSGRSLRQIVERRASRTDLASFGKYRYNLIVNERVGLLHLGDDGKIEFVNNHHVIYKWYEESQRLYEERMGDEDV